MGERAAEKFLRRLHYKILTRNYECSGGEIDLIARDGDTLVFVEVRTRSSGNSIRPDEIINPAKWSRVEKTARYFLMKKSLQHLPSRFDLVTVHMPDGKAPTVEHFPDAYQPRRR